MSLDVIISEVIMAYTLGITHFFFFPLIRWGLALLLRLVSNSQAQEILLSEPPENLGLWVCTTVSSSQQHIFCFEEYIYYKVHPLEEKEHKVHYGDQKISFMSLTCSYLCIFIEFVRNVIQDHFPAFWPRSSVEISSRVRLIFYSLRKINKQLIIKAEPTRFIIKQHSLIPSSVIYCLFYSGQVNRPL